MQCVICGLALAGPGFNALPSKMGKCCTHCNFTVVKPLREKERLTFVCSGCNVSKIFGNVVYGKSQVFECDFCESKCCLECLEENKGCPKC